MDMNGFNITREDTLPFVECMATIARADGQVLDEKRQMIESAMLTWGIDGNDADSVRHILNDGGDINLFVKQFSQPDTVCLLLQELINLAKIGGEYSDN